MDKTIHSLNQKAWYRLLKVVYVGIFVFMLLFLGVSHYFMYTGSFNGGISRCHANFNIADQPDREAALRVWGFSKRTGQKGALLVTDKAEEYSYMISSFDGFYKSIYPAYERRGETEFEWTSPVKTTPQDVCSEIGARHAGNLISNVLISLIVIGGLFEIGRRLFYYIYFGHFTARS